MDSAAQLTADGLAPLPILDPRNVTLEELARPAQDRHDPIEAIVARMIDSGDGQPPVSATIFNSAVD
jgi:hypothetical protein